MQQPTGPRYRYQVVFSVGGRIRFLSHLETVDTLLSALRRCGVTLSLSQGMKPKPLIKVALPRPVAVEAWSDLVEIELTQQIDPDQLALQLSATLPADLRVISVVELEGSYVSAASRVAGATFQIQLEGPSPSQLNEAVAAYEACDSVDIARITPKQRRNVDVRAFVGQMRVLPDGDGVRYYAALTAEGSAKPEEVVRALAVCAGLEARIVRVVRESITLAGDAEDGHVAEPALVGADVPEGPAKPWGAC